MTAAMPILRRSIRACSPCLAAALAVALLATEAPAMAPKTMPETPDSSGDVAAHIAEAARIHRLPPSWIRAVIRAESDFHPGATSSVGAMGLMQVMPATYAELRTRYALGADPYAPRDNILAGSAYLRELHDRFGTAGFLAAYNAGPGRYLDHLRTGRPLPRETRLYVARISRDLGLGEIGPEPRPPIRLASTSPARPAADAAAAPLFVVLTPERDARMPKLSAGQGSLFPPSPAAGDAP